ncbi:PLP-dependent transferase [Athelia psychrophila]|uniref:PLP-dependent transferase n=1 Tax=Athelia psychrophila TaxID=1759441 RepID=A0A166L5M5_9AGAM|nr:PLP-dependent transferase [Fibularhizoctonia sp. CBS 109695]
MSSLERRMRAALASRETRLIRRSLPSPAEALLVDFNSNDYLSLATHAPLRRLFLSKLRAAPDILGSGGSRLLVNGRAHADLEARLARFFGAGGNGGGAQAQAALLFNSGLDANAGFFACVPQPGDLIVLDEHIHASVHDGVRASRVPRADHRAFTHNSVPALRAALARAVQERPGLATGAHSVWISVESLYSMDGTFAPLRAIVEAAEEMFPRGNAYVVVDEAHTTGVYGPQGRGMVAALGLEHRVFARLHTFGKALAGSGAVLITTPLVRSYLVNYARPLIYTTSLSYASVIAVDCAFDMLENGDAQVLAAAVRGLSTHFIDTLRARLAEARVPPGIVSLLPHLQPPPPPPHSHPHPHQNRGSPPPSPIIALLTPRPRPLSAFLYARGMNARPITWPTVPKGKDRVRVCLHAGNTRAEVDALVGAVVEWAEGEGAVRGEQRDRAPRDAVVVARDADDAHYYYEEDLENIKLGGNGT